MDTNKAEQSRSPALNDQNSWRKLIENGNGYLNKAQYESFQKAISLVLGRLKATLEGHRHPPSLDQTFNFHHFINNMENRFMEDVRNQDELQKDAALTAFHLVQNLADKFTNNND